MIDNRVLQVLLDAIIVNHEWHKSHDDHDGYPESDLQGMNLQAIGILQGLIAGSKQPPAADFIRRTNDEYKAWCRITYSPEALAKNNQLMSLYGLWAWQEQERRKMALQGAGQTTADWPKLTAPATVGNGTFRAGVSSQFVVEAAQRQYEYAREAKQAAQPEQQAKKRWPFVESPGNFSGRLWDAYGEFGTMLAAVRYVLIENPPEMAAQPQQEPDYQSIPQPSTKGQAT